MPESMVGGEVYKIGVASLVDLSGVKIRVIQVRGGWEATWTITRRMESIWQRDWLLVRAIDRSLTRPRVFEPRSSMVTEHWIGYWKA